MLGSSSGGLNDGRSSKSEFWLAVTPATPVTCGIIYNKYKIFSYIKFIKTIGNRGNRRYFPIQNKHLDVTLLLPLLPLLYREGTSKTCFTISPLTRPTPVWWYSKPNFLNVAPKVFLSQSFGVYGTPCLYQSQNSLLLKY